MGLESITLVSSNTTLDVNNDAYLVDATNGNVVLTLPDSPTDGQWFDIKRVDASGNTVTLQGSSSTITIDGSISKTFAARGSCVVEAYGEDWYLFSPVGIN